MNPVGWTSDEPYHPPQGSSMYTMQYFSKPSAAMERIVPHNSPAQWRPGTPESQMPSALVLDIYYGVVALNAWGTDEFRDYCKKGKGKRFFPNPFITSEEVLLKSDKPGNTAKQAVERGRKCEYESEAGTGMAEEAEEGSDVFDYFDMVVGMHSRREEEAILVAKRDANQESTSKVLDWLHGGTGSESIGR